jgi:UDP-glucose 4-epimerase
MNRRTAKEPIKRPKVLVTGGLGFIGHNVVVKLINDGCDIAIVDTKTDYGIIPKDELDYILKERFYGIANRITRSNSLNIYTVDITNPELDTLFKAEQFDAVIHLASFPRQKVVNDNPTTGSKAMSEGLLNILELSRKHNVKRFTYVSSSMVYGDFTDNVTEDAVCDPKGAYAIMKYAGELLVKDYTRQYNLDHTIIRPSAVYGPVDVDDRVVSKFMLSGMQGKNLVVNGKMEKLDFTFVNDVANGIVQATFSDKAKNQTYNLTKSKGVTLYDAARAVTQITGKGNIDVKQKDKNFPSRGALSIVKAQKDFGYDPKIDIKEGFQIYYDWLQNSTYWQEQLNPKPKKQEEIIVTPVARPGITILGTITKAKPKVTPKAKPKAKPKVKTKVTPKVKTKVTPKVKTKVTPKVTPKVTLKKK